MSFYQIGKDLSLDDQWVLAHINAFLFPEDVQNAVWEGQLSIKHIRDLEPIIGANIEDATKIAREIILRRLTTRQAEELIRPRREEIEKARVDAAKKAIGAAAPIADVKLETPEEFERAAETLRKEARKRREETLTPKEKARIEAEKRRKEEERRKREEEAERKIVGVDGDEVSLKRKLNLLPEIMPKIKKNVEDIKIVKWFGDRGAHDPKNPIFARDIEHNIAPKMRLILANLDLKK